MGWESQRMGGALDGVGRGDFEKSNHPPAPVIKEARRNPKDWNRPIPNQPRWADCSEEGRSHPIAKGLDYESGVI